MQVSLPQSHARFPFTRILGQGAHLRVLRVLHLSGAPLSAPDIAERAGLTPQGTRLALDTLVGWGLVTQLGARRSRLFLLPTDHPLVDAVRALFHAEHHHWERELGALRRALAKDRQVLSAWLYGAVARQDDAPGEPIQMALIVSNGAVEEVLARAHRALADVERGHPGLPHDLVAFELDPFLALTTDAHRWQRLTEVFVMIKGTDPITLAKQRPRPVQQGLF